MVVWVMHFGFWIQFCPRDIAQFSPCRVTSSYIGIGKFSYIYSSIGAMKKLALLLAHAVTSAMALVGISNHMPKKHTLFAIQNADGGDRRSFLSVSLASFASIIFPSDAYAVKGAAEYDFEYYMRDLFMGNKPEGNLPISSAPPAPPPRNLKQPLLQLLLDDELQSCIPIRALAQITNIPVDKLSEQVELYRVKVAPAFKATHPWQKESMSDEYYFDVTCYALWKVASVLIQDYSARDKFARSIGSRLLDEMIQRELLSKQSIALFNKKDIRLTDLIPCIIEILDLFQATGYCSSYRLGDKNDEERSGVKVFDELDDEEIMSPNGGGTVNCLVSIFDPATLQGSLQITGEGSRFSPDFVGATLAAVFEKIGPNVMVTYENYFVDSVYRPNPKDFFPDERFYQFTIATSRSKT